jgi:hypothetical protein
MGRNSVLADFLIGASRFGILWRHRHFGFGRGGWGGKGVGMQ